jgi:hypothetical protein
MYVQDVSEVIKGFFDEHRPYRKLPAKTLGYWLYFLGVV